MFQSARQALPLVSAAVYEDGSTPHDRHIRGRQTASEPRGLVIARTHHQQNHAQQGAICRSSGLLASNLALFREFPGSVRDAG